MEIPTVWPITIRLRLRSKGPTTYFRAIGRKPAQRTKWREGLNYRIKILKKAAYGFQNDKYISQDPSSMSRRLEKSPRIVFLNFLQKTHFSLLTRWEVT